MMSILEEFQSPSLPEGLFWFNEPPDYRLGNGLELYTSARTDFWQNTHYGFQRDDGHCLFARQSGDFSLLTHAEFQPRERYDQCGLMVRVDDQNWIKVSTEYEDESTSRLGSVVTNLGYSDWATQDIPSSHREMWYRMSKRKHDFLIESSFDGQDWLQMRIAHLHVLKEELKVGLYACSPIGQAFWCRFSYLRITDNCWFYEGD
jgi:regulation of enolase protein 1 (concanavalin A-like superfamily)